MKDIKDYNNLVKIGKELNELLEPTPLIRVEVEYDSLLIDIIAACRLLEAGDTLTEKTVNDLKKLEIILPEYITIKQESIVTKTNEVVDNVLKSQSKKKGVIATIINILENGPIEKKEIIEKLKIKFPERNEKSMSNTLKIQIHSKLKDKVVKSEGGYKIEN